MSTEERGRADNFCCTPGLKGISTCGCDSCHHCSAGCGALSGGGVATTSACRCMSGTPKKLAALPPRIMRLSTSLRCPQPRTRAPMSCSPSGKG